MTESPTPLPLVMVYGERDIARKWREQDDPPIFFSSLRRSHLKSPHVVVVSESMLVGGAQKTEIKNAIRARLDAPLQIAFQTTSEFGRVPPVFDYPTEAELARR